MDSETKALLERLVKAIEENTYWGRLNVENNLRASDKHLAQADLIGKVYLSKYDENLKQYVLFSDKEIAEDIKTGIRIDHLKNGIKEFPEAW